MQNNVLILDFGSQYTQLIARRVRELNIYCEIHPFNKLPHNLDSYKAVILSGSPFSVRAEDAPHPDLTKIKTKKPLLGVCYGTQYLAHNFGGKVEPSNIREYGRANISEILKDEILFEGIPKGSQVWMSHSDTIQNFLKRAFGLRAPRTLLMLLIEFKGKIRMRFSFIQRFIIPPMVNKF